MPPLICTAHQGPGKSPDPSELFALTQHYTRARRLPYESDYGTSIAYCQTRVSLICTRMRGILNDGDDVVGWVVQAPPFLFLFTLTLTLSHQGRGDKRLPSSIEGEGICDTAQPLWIPAYAGMTMFMQ